MNTPSKRRKVLLLYGRTPGRPTVAAVVYRDYPVSEIERIEQSWAKAREEAAADGVATGLAPLEHEHWDWRNKGDSVEAGHHMLVAVECTGEAQGIMAVLRSPQAARLGKGKVVYVDYVESAPWNLKTFAVSPRFIGVGTVLIGEAVRLSFEMGLDGRIGLHSLPQAEAFYTTRCQMTPLGPDQNYYDLMYFEYTGQQAATWLTSIGESL